MTQVNQSDRGSYLESIIRPCGRQSSTAAPVMMYPCVIHECSQGLLYRYSFERGIAVRFKEMEVILLFDGFSKVSFFFCSWLKTSFALMKYSLMVLVYKLYICLCVCLCVAVLEESYGYFYLQQKSVHPESLGQFCDFPLALALGLCGYEAS